MVKSIDPSSKEALAKMQNTQAPKTSSKNDNATKDKVDSTNANPIDQLDIGKPVEKSPNYAKPNTVKPDMNRIEELKAEADKALQPLKDMVKELLRQQGIAFQEAEMKVDGAEGENKVEGKSTDEKLIDIPPEMRAEAQKMIDEDGEYGVDKTSTRLVEFAKAISGGDKSQVETLRQAIKDGYDAAEKAFGGTLPEISQQTLDMTMKKLDEWAKSEETEPVQTPEAEPAE